MTDTKTNFRLFHTLPWGYECLYSSRNYDNKYLFFIIFVSDEIALQFFYITTL